MVGSLVVVRGLPLLAAGCLVAAGAIAGCSAGVQPAARPSRAAGTGHRTTPPPGPGPSPSRTAAVGGIPAIGGDPAQLARQLSTAERMLDGGTAAGWELARQALIVQLACLRLAAHPGWTSAVIKRVSPTQRAAATADILATADLVALTPPAARLPPWRIIGAQSLATLLAEYRVAQAATGVGWAYLAAINLVETDFGRIVGPSSAGAQGPMQFMPTTWAAYGRGDIYRPRDAIMAAARFLLDHGAARDIRAALFAYNPSWRYVDAVLRYAHRILADRRALTGYYLHQIIYRLGGGWILLPPGFGISRAVHGIRLRV